MLPPIPSWEGLHVLIVHFPIALLFVAPLFIVASLLLPKFGRVVAASALALMVLGTLSLLVTVSTGEAAEESHEEHAEGGGAAEDVMEEHEELAENTRTAFIILTIVFAGIVAIPFLSAKLSERRPAMTAINAAFLVLYAVGAVMLANTSHLGGRLVHEFGVHAHMQPGAGLAGGGERRHDERDEHEDEHHDDDDDHDEGHDDHDGHDDD